MIRELILCAIAVPVLAQVPTEHIETRDYAPGGKVRIQFRAGELKIVRGADSRHIVLRYSAEKDDHKDASDRTKVQFETHGADATLKLNSSWNVKLRAVIEVPGAVDLNVRMMAGDLIVDGIEGNQDLNNSVGDITVHRQEYSQTYKQVHASVRVGDLEGLVFDPSAGSGKRQGWLGNTSVLNGRGEYTLRAHVNVGDIHFLPAN